MEDVARRRPFLHDRRLGRRIGQKCGAKKHGMALRLPQLAKRAWDIIGEFRTTGENG